MAEAAISFTVQKLGNFLIQKVGFLQGVEGEVQSLKAELKTMQCFLKDAGEKQANDERIRNWISEIREVAQDAEDVIETFILKVDTPRSSRGPLGRCACFPNHAYHINKIGYEIERIQDRLKAIDTSRERYGIQNLGEGMLLSRKSENVDEWRRGLSPWQKDKHVVGLKQDVELLLSKAILEGKKGLSIASIVGMVGIGKSTLASIVYNHSKVVDRFDCRAWVVISSEFSPKEIIKELVRQLLRPSEDKLKILETMEKLQMPGLQQMLHQHLQGRRYFIVLDDVWENAHWESLASAFPVQDKASILLLTSSRQDISSAGYVHKMKTLDPNQSWELFLNKTIDNSTNGKCPKDLETIGREIVKKCEGLPLEITVVGGLVAKLRQSKSEWENFLKGMNSHLRRRGNSVSTILELSYHNLPPELKACFLCLGFFKEDAVIRAKRLIHIWIAQGLIPQEGREETMEETARSYLDELINWNMVQVKDMGEGGRVKSCHLHDLLRELSIKKAKEEISFEILREEGSSQLSEKPRHRAIYCSGERFSYSAERNKRVRSLFFHGAGNVDCSPSCWKSFKLLRVLDFEDFGLKKLPDTIGDLIGLWYLGLRNNNLQKLPSSLGRLKNLQVLDIAKNIFVQVPNVIWKMDRLRHLYMSRIKCKVPLKIGSLKNLQTVAYIPVDDWMPKHLKEMTSLHKLGIEVNTDSDVMKLCTSLAMLEKLVCLNLRWYGFKPMASLDGLGILHRLTQLKLRGALNTLPSVSNFPPNLSCLSLVGTWLSEDPMSVLEKLPKLWYLKLDCAYNGEKMVISREGFPRLEVLSVYGLFGLTKIKVRKGGMSGLKLLEINECPLLKSLPKELRLISNFQAPRNNFYGLVAKLIQKVDFWA